MFSRSPKQKKFVAVIWGYSPSMYTIAPKENYHLHILEVAKRLGFKPYAIVWNSKAAMENDPHFDKDITVIDYKNAFQYIATLLTFSFQGALFYAASYEWQSFIVPFLARKTIFVGHTQPKRKTPFRQKIQNFVFKFYKAVRFVNEAEKDFLIEQGTDPKKIHIAPLVVSQEVYKLTNTEGRKDLVYFGYVTFKKNIATILKAFEIVKQTHPDIKLHIVGKVKDEFPETEGVVRHGYIADYDELVRILNSTLIFVNSSVDEGQCVAVFDAALCGNALCLPNIMSFTGVFKDTALFHDIYDHKKLAENILYYLSNPDTIAEYRKKNIDMISREYSVETVEAKMEKLLLTNY